MIQMDMGFCALARAAPYCSRHRLAGVQPARRFIARSIRAAGLLARDRRVPKPLRWGAAVGLLPIPGPIDEAILLLVAPLFFIFCRESMRDAWRRAEQPTFA
jgi:hypothetical protein